MNRRPFRISASSMVLLLVILGTSMYAQNPPSSGQGRTPGQPQARPASIWLKVFPQNYTLIYNDRQLTGTQGRSREWKRFAIPDIGQKLLLRAPGYHDLPIQIDPSRTDSFEFKLERSDSNLTQLGKLGSGRQPKSIIITPDGSKALVAQLDGSGIDIYTLEPFAHIGEIEFPPAIARAKGFVEFAALPWQQEIWVSQMTTNQVHVLDSVTLTYKQSMGTGGSWPKVITVHPYLNLVFVSNWIGETVAVFDSITKTRKALWRTTGTPRGMVVSPDGIYLYVASFGTGALDKFQVSTGRKVSTINMGRGAKRHLVVHPTKPILMATDMELGEVWVFDMIQDRLITRIPLGPKLNTCELSPDGRFLFVSSRGTNNPETYLIKGPDFGKVYVIDTNTWKNIDWVWGMNQPTGLAVHPTKPLLLFSNFLDFTIELYDFAKLYPVQ